MYQDEPVPIEPEFQQRYKLGQRGLRPFPLREMRQFNVNRFGQAPELTPEQLPEHWGLTVKGSAPPIPPWVLWLAIALIVWILIKK